MKTHAIDAIPSLRGLDIVGRYQGQVQVPGEHTSRTGFNAETDFFRSRIEHYAFHDLGHVADLASGFGRWSYFLAERNRSVTATDINEADLAYGRLLARDLGISNLEFVRGSILDLPFPDAHFDGIWVWAVFQQVDREVALTECSRVAKPGTRLLFGSANGLGKAIQKLCQGYELPGTQAQTRRDKAIETLRRGARSPAPPSIFTHGNIPELLQAAGLQLDPRFEVVDHRSFDLPREEYDALHRTSEFVERFLSDAGYQRYIMDNYKRLVRSVEFDFIFSALKP